MDNLETEYKWKELIQVPYNEVKKTLLQITVRIKERIQSLNSKTDQRVYKKGKRYFGSSTKSYIELELVRSN